MEIPVQNGASRSILVLACLAISALIAFQSVRIWTADRWMSTGRISAMERSAKLVPGNAEVWDRIGRFRQLDFENPDPQAAIQSYKIAVRANPGWAFYWLDLASAYEDVNDLPQAQEALDKAEAAYPVSALVSWNYGNFLVRAGKDGDGYEKIRAAVTSDPLLLPLAISRTWRSGENVGTLLNQALPANRQAYLQALAFFTQIRQPDAGLQVWQRLVGLGGNTRIVETLPFQDLLIENDRAEDEQRVWRDALRMAGNPANSSAQHSVIWNGDFSEDFVNGGLDWRWLPVSNVAASFDSVPSKGKGRSIRVDFGGGSNTDLQQPLQYVPVEPGRKYRFHGQLRTDQITTESGVQFSLTDPHHQDAVNFASANLIGTHAWTSVDADITAGPQTHFLLVRLRRIPSRQFENRVTGAVWIADVSLTPLADGERTAP
jgi:hypothetical protein